VGGNKEIDSVRTRSSTTSHQGELEGEENWEKRERERQKRAFTAAPGPKAAALAAHQAQGRKGNRESRMGRV
jgi:hypothetical protein